MWQRDSGGGEKPADERRREGPGGTTTIPLAPLGENQRVELTDPGSQAGGSFIVDSVGHILAFDRSMEKLTGWAAFEVVGQHKDLGIYDRPDETGLRRFESRPLYEGGLPRIDRTTSARLRIYRKDGAQLEVEALLSPLGGASARCSIEIKRVVARIGAPVHPTESAGIDPLTRLPSASAFRERLRETFITAERRGQTLAALFVNVDRFDELLGSYGMEAADDVLQRVAGILRASLRGDDFVARASKDCFGVLLEQTGRGDARHIGGRIRQTIESFAFTRPGGTGELRVTVSIGVSCYPADGESPSELMRRAEEALEEAHRLGRNRVWCYVRRPRTAVSMPVYFDGPSGHLLGESRDLSNSGLFVKTREMLPLGMRLGLSFRLPSHDEPIRLVARVARQVTPNPAEAREPGLGLEFERYSQEDRRRIEAFIHASREA